MEKSQNRTIDSQSAPTNAREHHSQNIAAENITVQSQETRQRIVVIPFERLRIADRMNVVQDMMMNAGKWMPEEDER